MNRQTHLAGVDGGGGGLRQTHLLLPTALTLLAGLTQLPPHHLLSPHALCSSGLPSPGILTYLILPYVNCLHAALLQHLSYSSACRLSHVPTRGSQLEGRQEKEGRKKKGRRQAGGRHSHAPLYCSPKAALIHLLYPPPPAGREAEKAAASAVCHAFSLHATCFLRAHACLLLSISLTAFCPNIL